ncbi:MAG: DUF4249 domain-containing protein [Ichthyobacteriaceae bacterium]|nr:DUF4249 domain-containing protein [Ichthyobacteriaceae bacterium]
MKKSILYIIVFIATLTSCEKVINVELKDSEKKIVIDGFISDSIGYNYIKLTNSSNFFDLSKEEFVTGATAFVTNKSGKKFDLKELEPGIYTNPKLISEPNNKYSININYKNNVITANSETQSSIKIDSFFIKQGRVKPGGNIDSKIKAYTFECYWEDKKDEENFYHVIVKVNNRINNRIFVTDDRALDGKTIPFKSSGISMMENDKVSIEVLSVDKIYFDFYHLLFTLQIDPNATPGNADTNIKGTDAIGLFNACTISAKKFVFKNSMVIKGEKDK